ncbi:Sigma factor regulator VreR (cytoplasmic membrane-localized) of trans-envelope signaling system [plant metagenome]|uniref:Sigma factor regulator VreR (Cytoplasmic membrane-localized) of trans-envelope signaling system n=1 Tax=plant metagenome TaxID=1297885 RepID=A0A484RBS5_9ZZZZ
MMTAAFRPPSGKLPVGEQASAWFTHLTSGRATTEDAAQFRQWRDADPAHQQAFAECSKTWQDLAAPLNEFAAAAARAPAPAAPRASRGFMPGRRAWLAGAAASVAGVWLAVESPLGLWPSLDSLAADHHTGTGEQKHLVLADGLTVEMNTRTALNVRDTHAALHIELAQGEAEILSRRGGQRAEVQAAGGRILVDGACVNVRHVGSQVQLSCLEGEVQLSHGTGVYTLAADQQLGYDAASVAPLRSLDRQVVSSWREGWLVFRGAPLAQVVEEINRYRPGRLVLLNAQLGRRPVQTRFALAQLADADILIRDAYGAKLTRLPSGVVVLS